MFGARSALALVGLTFLSLGMVASAQKPASGFDLSDVPHSGRRQLVYRAKPGEPLTVIPSSDPAFGSECNLNFPGFSGITNYDILRPWMVILRNDTGRVARAYAVVWHVTFPRPDGQIGQEDYQAVSVTTPLEVRHPSGNLYVDAAIYPGRERLLVPNNSFGPRDPAMLAGLPNDYMRTDATSISVVLDCAVYGDGSVAGPCATKAALKYFIARDAQHDEALTALRAIEAGAPAMTLRAGFVRRQRIEFTNTVGQVIWSYVEARANAARELDWILRRGGYARVRQVAAELVNQMPPHRAYTQLGGDYSRTKFAVRPSGERMFPDH